MNLKPEYIKIDREIIEAIQKDGSKQKIVENTVSYAHERDMRVIAEGIENEEEKIYSTEGYTHSDDVDGSTYIWSRKCLCG